jgi:hypothetical protein
MGLNHVHVGYTQSKVASLLKHLNLIHNLKATITPALNILKLSTFSQCPIIDLVKVSASMRSVCSQDYFRPIKSPLHRREICMALDCLSNVINAMI